MQQLLHTILCHPERSEGSHIKTNHVTSSLSRSQHLIKSRFRPQSIFYILFSIFLTLCSIQATAQPYQGQWAINGGSSGAGVSGAGWHIYAEQIYDVAIDQNNNYYFLANITGSNPQLNGQPVTEYGNTGGGNDIFLFSTTCNGTVRWSQAIGGG